MKNAQIDSDQPIPQITFTKEQSLNIYQNHVLAKDILNNHWDCTKHETTNIKNDNGAYIINTISTMHSKFFNFVVSQGCAIVAKLFCITCVCL